MQKVAYVSVTYLFTIEPELVGLDQNCSKEEFERAVDGYMEAVTDLVGHQADIFPNDIEVDCCGF